MTVVIQKNVMSGAVNIMLLGDMLPGDVMLLVIEGGHKPIQIILIAWNGDTENSFGYLWDH